MSDVLNILVALQADKAIAGFDNLLNKFTGDSRIAAIGRSFTAGVTVPIVGALGYATGEAVKFNSAINNTVRSLDLSTEETKSFSNEVLKLAPSLGLLPAEFANVAAEAGKMGVAKDEVAKFGATLAELATIADTPIDQFVKLGGSIKTVFKQSTEEFNVFGAAVNALDDKIGGTTPNILDFTSRVGAIGKSIGYNAQEVAAFGATFEKLGFSSDVAGTAFKNMVNGLFTISSASEPAKEAFESLGFSAVEFGKEMEADPKAALKRFLDTLNAVGSESEKSSLLVKIFGNEGLAAITSLAGSTDILSEAFSIAGDETANLDKKMKEFAGKMKDPAVQSKVLAAQMNALSIQFGQVLIPILDKVLRYITPLVASFGEFLTLNPEFAKFFVIAAGGLAVIGPVLIAIGGLVNAFTAISTLFASGGILAGIGAFVTGIGLIPVAIAAGVAAIAALVFNIGGFRDKAIEVFKTITEGLSYFIRDFLLSWKNGNNATINTFIQLWQALPGIAAQGLTWLGQQVASGFWAIVTNIPRILWELPGQVYKVFDFFIGGILDFLIELSDLMDWHIANAVLRAVNALWSFPQNIGSIFGSVRNAIVEGLNHAVSVLGEYSNIFYNAGLNLIRTFASGIGNAAGEAYNAVAGVMGNVRQYLPFSPAKVGALSDLDESGKAFLRTFADNLDINYLLSAIDTGLSAINTTSPAQNLTPATATSGDTSGSVIINFEQNINIDTKVTSSDVVNALKSSQREFLQVLQQAQTYINRRQA